MQLRLEMRTRNGIHGMFKSLPRESLEGRKEVPGGPVWG